MKKYAYYECKTAGSAPFYSTFSFSFFIKFNVQIKSDVEYKAEYNWKSFERLCVQLCALLSHLVRNFMCKTSRCAFLSLALSTFHLSNVHPNIIQFKCDGCQWQFVALISLSITFIEIKWEQNWAIDLKCGANKFQFHLISMQSLFHTFVCLFHFILFFIF